MRRRRPRADSFSVSLFPFLAVLICTFGVLIILLVIVVKAADQQNRVERQAQNDVQNEQIASLQNELDLQLIRVEGLRSLRPGLLSDLHNEKNRRAQLQSQIQELSRQAELINAELKLVSSDPTTADSKSTAVLLAETDRLQAELAAANSRLQLRREAAASNRPVKYSVVPHDGPDGTRRRPMYIECLPDKLVIQPYGVALTRDDFVEPIVANNPLDAALLAVREYFLKNRLTESGETPYPLLIVRPDGATSYVVARRAIKSWDEEFGYELIDNGKELDFGAADPQLQTEIESAIAAARVRQREYLTQRLLHRVADSQGSGSDRVAAGGLRASERFGGFVGSNGRIRQTSAATAADGQASGANKKIAVSGEADSGTGDSKSDAQRDADVAVKGIDGTVSSLAEERGEGWALPSQTENAVAYRRPVKVLVAADELTLEADSRSNRRVRISFDEGTAAATENLVEAIWRRIDTWGVAGVGGYWKPELDVVVMLGGEQQFQRLMILLRDSGINLKEHR